MTKTIAEILATRIAGVTYDDLPDAVRHWAKVGIMDTVGCTFAGASEPCAQIEGRVAAIGGANGPCLVFGTTRQVGPMDAPSINGTAAHALDYDDCSDTLSGHPSGPILPALFALAARPTQWTRLYRGLCRRLGNRDTYRARVNFHHYEKGWHHEKGWHPTATLGVFGAAAACSKLLGLSVEETACWRWQRRSPLG